LRAQKIEKAEKLFFLKMELEKQKEYQRLMQLERQRIRVEKDWLRMEEERKSHQIIFEEQRRVAEQKTEEGILDYCILFVSNLQSEENLRRHNMSSTKLSCDCRKKLKR
jgi:hypothetical protein